MSRHRIESERYAEVTVGWDRPMGTFFLQVHGPADKFGAGALIHWIGKKRREIREVHTLMERADAEFGISIPRETTDDLFRDQEKGD